MKKSIVLIITVLTSGIVFAADANKGNDGSGPHKGHREPGQMDTDKDGKVSLAEFTAGAPKDATPERIAKHFKMIDANGDGFITKDEFAAMRNKLHADGDQHAGGGKHPAGAKL